MSVRSIPDVERELVMTYLSSRWIRSQLAALPGVPPVPDPGHGENEVCPVIYYGTPFDPGDPDDVAKLSLYAVRELRGYGYFVVTPQDGDWPGQELPLNIVGSDWVVESPTGPVVVEPQAAVEDGATVLFVVPDGSHPDFTADVATTTLHGVGFVVVNLSELQVTSLDHGSRGSLMARVLVRFMLACPPAAAPALAEVYAGALAALFRGVTFVPDAGQPDGDLRRDLADSGVTLIRQWHRSDPVQERPNRLSETGGWVWFTAQLILRRQYRPQSVGVQAPTAA